MAAGYVLKGAENPKWKFPPGLLNGNSRRHNENRHLEVASTQFFVVWAS
jgi:hypothetical protein